MKRPAGLMLPHALERVSARRQDGPAFAEHSPSELRDAYRRALLRTANPPARKPIRCAACPEPIRPEDVTVRTERGDVHTRCINGPYRMRACAPTPEQVQRVANGR